MDGIGFVDVLFLGMTFLGGGGVESANSPLFPRMFLWKEPRDVCMRENLKIVSILLISFLFSALASMLGAWMFKVGSSISNLSVQKEKPYLFFIW